MQIFRRKSSVTIRQSRTDSTASSPTSPPSPSSLQENPPTVAHRLFRRKSSVNIRPSTGNGSPQEAPPSPPRRLFRRKSSVTIRPSTAAQVRTTTSSPTQEESPTSPRPYTSAASPPPIPTQFLEPLPTQPMLDIAAPTTHLTPPASSNPNRASNRFSTTSTLFERELPAPPARPSPLAQIQQSPIEAYVTQARETDLQRLGYDAMMALAWVQAEERRRAATSRGWQHDPWRGGFGPSNTAERVRVAPVPALRVDTGVVTAVAVATSSPGEEIQGRVVQERSGNGLRERLGRRGLMKSQSIFNLRWRVRDVA